MTKTYLNCPSCQEEILQRPYPTICPYCGSKIVISAEEIFRQEIEEVKILERAGRYEDAALRYERLEMWDEAGECRRMTKTNYVVSANFNIDKNGAISIACPHCGASQSKASGSNQETCKYCGKNFVIPKKVLDLL